MVLSFASFLDLWDLAIFVTPRRGLRQMLKANLSMSAREYFSREAFTLLLIDLKPV